VLVQDYTRREDGKSFVPGTKGPLEVRRQHLAYEHAVVLTSCVITHLFYLLYLHVGLLMTASSVGGMTLIPKAPSSHGVNTMGRKDLGASCSTQEGRRERNRCKCKPFGAMLPTAQTRRKSDPLQNGHPGMRILTMHASK
jgi:hypothetical protein